MDLDLLKLVEKKEQYLRLKPHINAEVLSPEAQVIYNNIENYFKNFPVDEINWDSYESFFLILKKTVSKKDEIEKYKAIFSNIKTHSVGVAAEKLLEHYITLDYARKVGSVALDIATHVSGRSMDEVGQLVKDYDRELGRALKPSDLFVTDVSTAISAAREPGLEWALEELNISLGPLRKGDFVTLAARPETGKTTFIAHNGGHMARQLPAGRPLVWVNNEERSDKVFLRVMQAQLGLTTADVLKDEAAAKKAYDTLMDGKGGVLVLKNDTGLNSVSSLTALFKDLNPGMIVFDQLDKVEGLNARDQREDERLGKLYKWARELAHEYGPVIAVSQCDASAENTEWIGMDQLRGSKTDKPGEADAIITIGRTAAAGRELDRFINIPKNKLFGGPRSDETQRHGKWEVKIQPDVARYKGTR